MLDKYGDDYKVTQIGSELLGPVVQSIVSLTKSLVNDSLSLLVHLKSSVLIFFAEKLLTFFRQKMAVFLCIICFKF